MGIVIRMKLILAIFTFLAFCLDEQEYEREYFRWMESFGKQERANGIDNHKFENFKRNLNEVLAHNSTENGFEIGLNEFSDMSLEEFHAAYLGKTFLHRDKTHVSKRKSNTVDYSKVIFPTSFDYREIGAVNPVRRQNACGACYAITSTGSIEGAIFMKTKKLLLLSPQQLIDCSSGYGNEGCKGGDMINSFNYTIETGGLYSDSCYPFADKLQKCRSSEISLASKKTTASENKCERTTIDDMYDVEESDEQHLAYTLLTYGPVGVGIDSTPSTFAMYKSGIYEDKRCNKEKICHAMLLVGYGVDRTSGKKFWILRNSWGTSWGIDGYMLLKKDAHDMCGVASYACVAVVD